MSFEEWIGKQLDKELKHNPPLRKIFAEHPDYRKDYIAKIIDSEPTGGDLWQRYREETGAE